MNDDTLIPLRVAAAKLGICVRTLRRLGERGELQRPVKVGRCSRVPLSEILAYMNRLKEAR